MRAVSLNQLMIDVLERRYPRENVTHTVTVSKLTDTRGSSWSGPIEVPLDGHTDLYVLPRGGIIAARHRSDILEPIVRPHAYANGDAFILMQDNAPVHTAQVSMTFIDDTLTVPDQGCAGPVAYINRGAPSPRTCNIFNFNGCKINSGGKR